MKDEKAEVYIRVLDDNHRVCIPIQVRQEMEVSPGCSIEFLADGDRIILRKYGQEVSSRNHPLRPPSRDGDRT